MIDISRRLRAKHVLFLIDSCYAGLGLTRSGTIPPSEKDYLRKITTRKAHQMLTAGGKGEQAHEEGGHGVFTKYVLEALGGAADREEKGFVTFSDIASYVKPKVSRYTSAKQVPQYGSIDGEGEFVFVLAGLTPTTTVDSSGLDMERRRLAEEKKRLEAEKSRLAAQRVQMEEQKKLEEEKRRIEEEQEQIRKEKENLDEDRKEVAVLQQQRAHESITWQVNSVWPPKNQHSIGLHEFAQKVKSTTQGGLILDVKTGGALGYRGPELLKVVRDGLIPVSDMLIAGVAGDEKIYQIVTLPFLVRDFDELKLLLDISRPYFNKAAKKWNQKILYFAPWPGAGLWTKKRVTSLDDMKGLKVRTYDRNGALVMQAADATPLALPFSEVYTSLQTGIIDSVMTSTPTAVDGKFWEVLKYFQPFNIIIAANMVTVNLDAFEKLPKAQQDALLKAGRQMEAIMWPKIKKWDKDMEAISNRNGIQTVKPKKKQIAELEKITEGIRVDWLKTAPPDAKKIYADFMRAVRR